jgi:hypothetical protein
VLQLKGLLRIISMEDFLKHLKSINRFPKNIEISELIDSSSNQRLYPHLENLCYMRMWHPGRMFIGLNLSTNAVTKQVEFGTLAQNERLLKHVTKSNNREIVHYNETMHKNMCIYFPGDNRDEYRLLTHFYAFIYWAQQSEDHRYRRCVKW